MPSKLAALLVGLLAGVGLISAFGCSDLKSSSGGGGGGGSATAAAVVVEPTPTIEIVSPAPGSFLAPGQAAVTGRVSKATGSDAEIHLARVNGELVTVQPDGSFQTFVTMVPGLNVIEGAVSDTSGRSGSAAAGVLAGDWRDTTQTVRDAAFVRVTNPALDAMAKVVESSLWATDLNEILRRANPIFDTSLLWVQVWVDIQQVRFRDLQVRMQARTDGIHLVAEVLDPIIDVTVQANLGLGAITTPEPVTIVADRVELTGRVMARTRQDHTIRMTVEDPALRFHGFRALAASQLISTIEPLVRGMVQRAIEREIVGAIQDDLQPLLDQALLDYLTPNASDPFDVFGKPFLIDVRGEQITFDNDGVSIGVRFDAPPVQLTGLAQARAPSGSLRSFGTRPMPTVGPGIFASIDDDAANRLLHGLWAGGVADIDIDGAFLAAQGLNLPIALELGALKGFLPELRDVGADNAPLGLRLRPGLPPVVQMTGTPNLIELQAGELGVEITVDRGQGPEPLLVAAVHARLGLNAVLTSDGLKLSTATNPRLRFDVRAEPLVELDNRRIEVLLTVLLTPLLPQLLNGADIIPVPHIRQLQLFNSSAYVDGPARDHLSVIGDMLR